MSHLRHSPTIRAERDAPAGPLAHERCHRGCSPRARRESLTTDALKVKVRARATSTRRAALCPRLLTVQPTSPPSRDELAAASRLLLPDLVAGDPTVVFCGINPSLYSAATGHHFARPGNRFWPALFGAGWTPRLLRPWEQQELPSYGVGVTNLAPRPTVAAAELSAAELLDGAAALQAKLLSWKPRAVAFLGVTAYRVGFGDRHAVIGRQRVDVAAGVQTWVLPNPSGLNAHYQLPDLARIYGDLRTALLGPVDR